MQIKDLDGQVSMFAPGLPCGKTSPAAEIVPRTASPARISRRSSNRSSGLKNRTFMLLDLRPGAGNMLGPYWEYDPAWLGRSGRLNTSACPKGAIESSLLQILQATVPSKYYLSRTACRGILRRAKERGKPLPPQLELALKLQAGIVRPPPGVSVSELLRTAINESCATEPLIAFAANQRDEVRNLYHLAGALGAQPGMKQQTFIADCLNPWDTQRSRVFMPEGTAPTLAGSGGGGGKNPGGLIYAAGFSASGGMMPSVLCLNDQGGQRMDCTENYTATLRAQSGHPPLVCLNDRSNGATECPEYTAGTQELGCQPMALYENHGIDARYKGPLPLAPALSARMGTGGNKASLVLQKPAIFARQRADVFKEREAASTESAHQHKDATGLVLQPDDGSPDIQLIRRLVPRECELLQGFPPDWTNLPGASDSARYMALGNSVPIPCVEYLMQGIALVLRAGL